MAPRHATDDDDRRRTATVTDDFELLPPEVDVRGDVPDDVRQAVEAAIDEEPNALDNPVLHAADDHRVAYLTASYNERPAMTEAGEVGGWLPPYRSSEDFHDALREALPDGVEQEIGNDHRTDFYSEAGR